MGTLFGARETDPAERLIAPTMWAVTAAPAAAAQAVATKAAGATGVKHVCYAIVATIAAGATAQTPIDVQLLDGASLVFTASLSAPVDGVGSIVLGGLAIEGTAATSMTLQFSAAGAAATVERVTLIGYDVD
jgi:hypothetical protein